MINQDLTLLKYYYILHYIKYATENSFLQLWVYIVTHIALLPLLSFISNKIFLKAKALYSSTLNSTFFLLFGQGIFILHWTPQIMRSVLPQCLESSLDSSKAHRQINSYALRVFLDSRTMVLKQGNFVPTPWDVWQYLEIFFVATTRGLLAASSG